MPKRCDQGSSLLCSHCQKSGCWHPLGSVIYPAQGYYTYPLLSQPWLFQSTACEGFPWLYRQPNLLLKFRFSFHLLTVHLHPDDPQTPKPTCPKMDSSCVIPWTSLPAPHQKKKSPILLLSSHICHPSEEPHHTQLPQPETSGSPSKPLSTLPPGFRHRVLSISPAVKKQYENFMLLAGQGFLSKIYWHPRSKDAWI